MNFQLMELSFQVLLAFLLAWSMVELATLADDTRRVIIGDEASAEEVEADIWDLIHRCEAAGIDATEALRLLADVSRIEKDARNRGKGMKKYKESCAMCARPGRPGDCYEGPVKRPEGTLADRCPGCGYPYTGIAKKAKQCFLRDDRGGRGESGIRSSSSDYNQREGVRDGDT